MNEPILCACGCQLPVRIVRYPNSHPQPKFLQGHQQKGTNNGNYRGGKTRYACGVCGTEFFEYASQPHRTCGADECYRKWQGLVTTARGINKVPTTCDQCGLNLERFPSHVRRTNFCSTSCQREYWHTRIRGPRAGLWRGGRGRWLRQFARQRDDYKCVVCGFDFLIHVHHVTPLADGGPDEATNVVSLCPNHHALAHAGIIDLEPFRRFDVLPSPDPPARTPRLGSKTKMTNDANR